MPLHPLKPDTPLKPLVPTPISNKVVTTLDTAATPVVTEANEMSNQYSVPFVKFSTINARLNGAVKVVLVPAKSNVCDNPTAVPVKAAPLAGGVPVPYRICTVPPWLLLGFVPEPSIITTILPDPVGVISAASPIIKPTVELVPVGAAVVETE